jgi:hypothetical protein
MKTRFLHLSYAPFIFSLDFSKSGHFSSVHCLRAGQIPSPASSPSRSRFRFFPLVSRPGLGSARVSRWGFSSPLAAKRPGLGPRDPDAGQSWSARVLLHFPARVAGARIAFPAGFLHQFCSRCVSGAPAWSHSSAPPCVAGSNFSACLSFSTAAAPLLRLAQLIFFVFGFVRAPTRFRGGESRSNPRPWIRPRVFLRSHWPIQVLTPPEFISCHQFDLSC